MTKMSFGDQLSDSLVLKSFRNHPFFTAVDAAEFTKEQAEILIQQWRHPLTGVTDNEWVSIHVQQEPDHVEEANHTLLTDFDAEQERVILAEADNLWKLGTAFFDRLTVEADINQGMSARGEL